MAEQHNINIVIARCFSFLGPDLPVDAHFAIGNFIRDAIAADEIIVHGDGTPLRTYLDQDDLAHWLLTLLVNGQHGEAYNVGSNEVISIAKLAHLVRDLLSPGKPVHILGKPNYESSRNRYIPDIRKTQNNLGLDIATPLTQSIKCAATTNF